jgi:diphthamide biosynthesis enzyme Dph1/Dph2-like protein
MADIIHAEARRKFSKESVNFPVLEKLTGKTISLAATIQYLPLIGEVKAFLEKQGKKVMIQKGAFYGGHVIGCNPIAFDSKADTLLLLADGKFHALNNALILNRKISVFNTKSLEEISHEDLDIYNKKIKGKINKFLHAEKIGLIVSTKKGQNYANASELAKRMDKKGKKVYVFETDTINLPELENFPIKFWVNTACYGLALDSNIIVNYKDILPYI